MTFKQAIKNAIQQTRSTKEMFLVLRNRNEYSVLNDRDYYRNDYSKLCAVSAQERGKIVVSVFFSRVKHYYPAE